MKNQEKIKRAKIYFFDSTNNDYRFVPFYHFVGIIGIYQDNYFEVGANTIANLIVNQIKKQKLKGRLKIKKNGKQK